MAKGSFSTTFRRVRAESGLNLLKILATALAAVTMAVISSRLTTVVNSLLLTGLVSVGSALVNEFYRTVLTVGAESTKKVVAPIIHVDEDGNVASVEEAPGKDTAKGEPSKSAAGEATDAQETTRTETVAVKTAPEAPETPKQPKKSEPPVEGGKWALLWYRIRHNQVIQMSLVFAVVSLITLGVSYTMAARAGATEINVHQTHVTSQSLDGDEKEALLREAIEAAKSEESPTEEQGSVQEEPREYDAHQMEQQLNAVLAENEALAGQISELQNALNSQQALINDLQARLDALDSRVHEGATFPDPDTP